MYYGRYDLKDSSNLPDYVFDMEYLYPGFSVNKPTFLQSNFFSVVCFVVGFFIFLNHFVHNRKLFGFKGLFKELKGWFNMDTFIFILGFGLGFISSQLYELNEYIKKYKKF